MEGNWSSKLCCAAKPLTDLEQKLLPERELYLQLVSTIAFWRLYFIVASMTMYQSGFSTETEPTRYIQEEFYYKELAHAMKKAKFPHLLSTSWRPRKAAGVIQSKSMSLRTRSVMGRRRLMSSPSNQAARADFFLPLPFVLFRPLLNDAHSHCEGQTTLLSLLIQMLISSGNTLTDTPRNIVRQNIQAPHHVIKLTPKINQ